MSTIHVSSALAHNFPVITTTGYKIHCPYCDPFTSTVYIEQQLVEIAGPEFDKPTGRNFYGIFHEAFWGSPTDGVVCEAQVDPSLTHAEAAKLAYAKCGQRTSFQSSDQGNVGCPRYASVDSPISKTSHGPMSFCSKPPANPVYCRFDTPSLPLSHGPLPPEGISGHTARGALTINCTAPATVSI